MFLFSPRLISSGILTAIPQTATLDDAGSFSISLPATESHWIYEIVEGINGNIRGYELAVPSAVVLPTAAPVTFDVLATQVEEMGEAADLDQDLLDIAALSPANDDVIQRKSDAWTNRTLSQYKTDLSLNNVTNTSDANKPVSTAQQTALDLKANLASPTLTGTPASTTAAPGTNTTQISTTAFVQAAVAALIASAPGALDTLDELAAALGDDANFASTLTGILANKQPLANVLTTLSILATTADKLAYFSGTDTATLTDLTVFARTLLDDANAAVARTTLVLGNVDNTSDANKPVSSAAQTALDLKANLASPTFTGNPAAPTPSANDNDTSIATTAFVQTELADYATLASPTLTGNPLAPTPSANDNDTSIATTAYVQTELTAYASDTVTETNKRITPRVTSETSSATPTINTDNSDMHSITALAAAITSFTTNLTGTPTNGQKLIVRVKDDGTGRAITWGASFVAYGVALPTTTVASKVLTVGFIWDSVSSKFGCIASAQEA